MEVNVLHRVVEDFLFRLPRVRVKLWGLVATKVQEVSTTRSRRRAQALTLHNSTVRYGVEGFFNVLHVLQSVCS